MSTMTRDDHLGLKMELSSNWTSEEAEIAGALQLYTDNLPEALSELLNEDAGFILSQQRIIKEKCYLQLKVFSSSPQIDSSSIGSSTEQLKRSLDSHANEWPRIVSITVLSESKLVEVFVGKHEEYLGSFSSTVVEQFADSLICRTVIDLGKPQSYVKLVFKKTFDDSSLMVFGVFARTAAKESSAGVGKFPSFSRFSTNHLDSVLTEHGVTTLSKEAAMFKQVLQQYNDRGRKGGGALTTPFFPFSSLLPLLEASNTGGPATLSNLAALVQKQYPLSGLSKFETEASKHEDSSKKTLVSGTKLVTFDGSFTNSKRSVLKFDQRVADSDDGNGSSVKPSGALNFNVPNAELQVAASFFKKSDTVSGNISCEDATSMDISPVDERRYSNSSLSSCGNEKLTPDHILLRGTDCASQNNLRVGLKQVNCNLINSLPVQEGSDKRPSGQLFNVNEVQKNRSYDSHFNEHLIGLCENIIDKKLAAFEKRIETIVSQKLSETTFKIFTKLNSIERALVRVPCEESSSSIM